MREKLLRSAGTKPAPDALLLVQAFINSADLDRGTDELGTVAGLRAWLTDLGLIETSARVSQADVVAAKAAREALRDLALANNGGVADPNALETLNRAARCAQLSAHFEAGGRVSLESRAPGVDGAIGRILALAFNAMETGQWSRLKACPADTCRWAFFDETKNRSGTWCAMSVCGNRAKARSFRKRHVTADHAH